MTDLFALALPSFSSLTHILLAILGLGFLIFIHELGHYYMARRTGMKVDVFSIGFGSAIYSWMRDGVKWQIGWLPFGGFVKISGTETEEGQDPYEVKDGYFGRGPWARIKVAFMGPFVNLVFAFLAFTAIWMLGGREKNFSEYTKKLGWIDPKSELYLRGVRPGDEIEGYNGSTFSGSKEHLMAPMTLGETIEVSGFHFDSTTGKKEPYSYPLKPYSHPESLEKGFLTLGILAPASYIVYDKLPDGAENPLPPESPLIGSGIEYGDRVVAVDGIKIYSLPQLTHVLNDSRALLTIERDGKTFFRRVPRVLAEELRWDAEFKEELIDWQFEAKLNQTKLEKLYTIPYNLNNNGVVEAPVRFIDPERQQEVFPAVAGLEIEMPLQAGDKIVAVDGKPASHSYQILADLQEKNALVVVKRHEKQLGHSLEALNQNYDKIGSEDELYALMKKASSEATQSLGDLVLLKPVTLKSRRALREASENALLFADEAEAQKSAIEQIEDPEKKAKLAHYLELQEKQLMLGLPAVQDKKIDYNPNPFVLFYDVFDEIWQTLKALFTGALSPKWMSGPLGIIQIVHSHSMHGIKEALYWLGVISLNLGFLNLLPIPVLDGGTICFALYELVTGKRLSIKTMERLIIPFALFLIGFFFFLTYNDVLRIFS